MVNHYLYRDSDRSAGGDICLLLRWEGVLALLPAEAGQEGFSKLDKRAGGDASHDFSASACIPYPESFGSSCVHDLTNSTLRWLNFLHDVTDVTNQLIPQ